MSSLDDVTELNCSGIITYTTDDGEVKSGYILMPCGADHDTNVAGTIQIPYKYQIYRERARLAPCCYWRDSSPSEELDPTVPNVNTSEPAVYSFTNVVSPTGTLPDIDVVDQVTAQSQTIPDPDLDVIGGWEHETSPSFIVTPRTFFPILINGATSIPTKCKKTGAENWHQGLDGTPPCNGAKTECPFYTGPSFKYIKDEHMAPGQPVLGQMVQELRSLILDWKNLEDGQERWESSFDVPYIWGRDFDDLPTAIATENYEPAPLEEIPVYTILTKIFWDVAEEDVILSKVPGEATGTEVSDGDGDNLSPPDFPTIVNELGIAKGSPIKITFPSLKENETFEYSCFDLEGKYLYIAGLSSIATNVYIVNRTILSSFPNLEILDLEDPEQSQSLEDFIVKQVIKSYSIKQAGFAYVTSDASRFWHLESGIELKPGLNEIFALTQINEEWSFQKIKVSFKFGHCEFVQDGHEGLLPLPQTRTLKERITNLNTKFPISFYLLPIADPNVVITKVYQYYVLGKDYSRFLKEIDPPPNLRFWKVVKTSTTVAGSNKSGKLKWSKFDNCNRYLVEIKEPVLSAAIPIGLDRSWEPTSIKFSIEQEPGTSSHGEQQQTEVEMVVVEDFGRSYSGNRLPVRFMIVEPKEEIDLRTPAPQSLMTVKLDIFEAFQAYEEGEDALPELLGEFKDDNLPEYAGGAPLTPPSEDDELATSLAHQITKTEYSISVGSVQKFDMSYIVEVGLKGADGKVVTIGRKWIAGVGDIYDCWSRDIDIVYAWLDNHQFKTIFPDYYRKRVDLIDGSEYPSDRLSNYSQVLLNKESKYTVYRPRCGDHEVTFGKQGPMFSPYEDCDPPFTEINDLSIRVSYRPRIEAGGGLIMPDAIDEKYRGPDLYFPEVYKHNVLFYLEYPCIYEFSLGHYIRGGSARWAGFSRIRGPISAEFNPLKFLFYQSNGWRLPQFGNIGRDRIRVFRTMHYREYIYLNGSVPTVAQGWMPGVPFIGSTSVFDKKAPRTLYDQMVEDIAINPNIDYSSFEGLEILLDSTSEGIAPVLGIGLPKETMLFERKKFDDVYRVKRIRTLDGVGTRFPEHGFYFNFRSKDVVWAFPEQQVALLRNESNITDDYRNSLSFIGGVSVQNPKTELDGGIIDRFGRSVHISIPEGKHTIKIKNPQYNEETGELESYAKLFINEEYPIYFDRFTGEIKDTAGPSTTSGINAPLYSVQDLGELEDYIEDSDPPFDFGIEPYFEFISEEEANTAPKNISELDKLEEFINPGNLYYDLSTMYIYALTPPEGPLSNEEIPWVGFFPSAKVENIVPAYMPKTELIVEDDFEILVNFTVYPGIDWQVRGPKSNVDINNSIEGFVGGLTSTPTELFEWRALDFADQLLEDPTPGPSPYDIRRGQIDPITVKVKLGRPIELSYLEMAYSIYGRNDTDATDLDPGPLAPFDMDPSFKIVVKNHLTGQNIVLLEKPRFDYKSNSLKELTRSFVFYTEENQQQNTGAGSKIDPIVTEYIEIQVGARKNNVGIKLGNLALKHYILNEQAAEEIGVLEPKFIITTGLHLVGNPLARAAQDDERLTGIVSTPDTSDSLEYAGIAELWKPQDFSEPVVKTKGKLRREWANKFSTFDTRSFFEPGTIPDGDVSFFDSTVAEAEKRQFKMIEALADTYNNELYLKEIKYKYLLLPQDRQGILESNGNTSYLDNVSNLTFKGETFDFENLHTVSKSENIKGGVLSTPWQDKGFRACVSDTTKTAGCFGVREPSAIGGRGPHLITETEHTVCNQRLFEQAGFEGSKLGSFDLFEVVGNFEDGLYASGAAGALTAGEQSDFLDLAYQNAQGGSTQTKINKYREELARRRRGYTS